MQNSAPTTSHAGAGGSWRLDRTGPAGRPARILKRATYAAACAVLVAICVYLLVNPFRQPTTRLVSAWIEYPVGQSDWPVWTAADENIFTQLVADQELPSADPTDNLIRMAPEEETFPWRKLEMRLATESPNITVICVSAQGVVYRDRAYLRLPHFRPSDPEAGLLPISDLLQRIGHSRGAQKLVIIDAGRPGADMLALADNFASRVARDVQRIEDPRMWILLSHADGEASQIDPQLGGSRFRHSVLTGLQGAADLDRDRSITIGELHEYVQAQVSNWVRMYTDGRLVQTPQLIGGVPAGNDPRRLDRTVFRYSTRKRSADPAVDEAPPKSDVWPKPPAPSRMVASAASIPGGNANQHLAVPVMVGDVRRILPVSATPAKGADEGVAADPPPANVNASAAAPSSQPPNAPPKGAEEKTNPSSPDSNGSSQDVARDVDKRRRLAASVMAAWQLVDAMRQSWGKSNGSDPIDVSAPHLWRLFQQRLCQYERDCTLGTAADVQRASEELTDQLEQWQARRQPMHADDRRTDFQRELDARLTGQDLSACIQWLRENSPAHESYDLRMIPSLLSLAGTSIPPELAISAISLRRQAEQVIDGCAMPGHPGFVEAMARADYRRRLLEAEVLDRIADDFVSRSEREWIGAQRAYQQLSADSGAIVSAWRARNELCLRLPYIIHMYSNTFLSSRRIDRLHELLKETLTLADALESPAADIVTRVPDIADRVIDLQEEVEHLLLAECLAKEGRASSAGANWCAHLLLTTPLLSASTRREILYATAKSPSTIIDFHQAADIRLSPTHVVAIRGEGTRQARTRWALQARYLSLGISSRSPLRPARDALIASADRLTDDLPIPPPAHTSPAPLPANADIDQMFSIYRDLVRRGEELQEELIGVLPDFERAREAHGEFDRLLRTIDPRDASRLADADMNAIGLRLAGFARHRWRWQRLLSFRDDATAEESAQLEQEADLLVNAASQLFSEPRLSLAQSRGLRIRGAETMTLDGTETQSIACTVEYDGNRPTPAWLILQYNPRSVEVQAEGFPVYGTRSNAAASNVDASNATMATDSSPGKEKEASYRSEVLAAYQSIKGSPPSVTLTRGVPIRWRIQVRAPSGLASSARVVAQVLTSKHLSRHNIDIGPPLPAAGQIVVQGPASTVSSIGGSYRLHPVPGVPIAYSFSLLNRQNVLATYGLELYAFSRPGDIVMPHDSQSADGGVDQTGTWRAGRLVAQMSKLELLPGQSQPISFALPAATKQADAGATSPGQPGSIECGALVAAVTDLERQRVSYQRIDIIPQRPRRFLEPVLRYDRRSRTIDIRFKCAADMIIPAEGISLQAELSPADMGLDTSRLEDVVRPTTREGKLQIRLRPTARDVCRIAVHVGEYPRAFLYDIDPSAESGPQPESADHLSISITGPPQEFALSGKDRRLPVDVRIDAPAGAFQNARDFAVVWFDLDRDGELGDEPQFPLAADRQVRVMMFPQESPGQLQLSTTITDYHLELLPSGAKNTRIDICARVSVDGQVGDSPPVTVVLDSVPPRIAHIRQQSVTSGAELSVLVDVTDDELSGIARVEACWDESGEFPEQGPVLRARHDVGLGWVFAIPTKEVPAGTQGLLVRAIDRAGNVSTVQRVELTLDNGDLGAPSTAGHKVHGRILFGQLPVPGAEVALELDGKPIAPPTVTNAAGAFVWDAVPDGKYQLKARGLFKNRQRSAEMSIDVPAAPAGNAPKILQLR